ncbi:putative leucine-rich repeat-containing protein DDB_G0290503 [Photinus pyralis]|uniref:putative leucine-rich repeat-containing protein DDB_G0290503 n=1 Tax=Photinus pyralis TaxID=7054 RepID=UPI001266F7CE|nr:putative leucine-rich repeat-containing protein DDB_G0290503 [Photinus pyralis]
MSEEWKIQYCKLCKEFFLDSCGCLANFQSTPALSIISGVFAMLRKLRTQKPHPALARQSVEFSRYINLAPPDTRTHVCPTSDFYMYMFTMSGEQKGFSDNKSATLSSSSAVSVNSRRSGSGGILKNLIGKAKKKKKSVDEYSSNPFVEKGDSCFSEDDQSDTTQCTVSDAIKEVPSKSKIPVLKKSSFGSSRGTTSAIDLKNGALWKYPSHTELHMPVCNLPELNSFDSSMREADRLLAQVRASEMHIAHLLSKYVQDSLFKEELLQALTKHSKLSLEAERYTRSFSNDSLQRSNEIARIRETETQERLNSFIRNNRMLQDDVEELARKNEKLCIKLQQFSSRERSPDTCSGLLETMNKNNDVLRDQVSSAVSKIEHLENYVQKVQGDNRVLEEKLHDATSQLHAYKDLEHRWDVEHKLEQVQLTQELNKNRELLKESVEAGKLLLDDLDGIKQQWQSASTVINKAKSSLKSHSLPDLISLFRSCISELSSELQVARNNEKDLQCLKDEVARNEEQLKQHKFEEDRLRNELKLLAQTELELQNCRAKLSNAEKTLGKEVAPVVLLSDFDQLKKEAVEKDEELLLLHEQNATYKSENDTLRMQMQGLRQVLSANGTGEVADVQEKLATFQSQYYQILSEKNALLEKLHSVSADKVSLGQLQNTTSQFVHAQQQELDAIKRDYRSLRQQFDVEHEQAITLRLERNKLKEEKSVLKQIYLQLKNEINRVQTLEGKVVGMNMEANRLAVIADYNKQLGEKLQCEVVERDVKISELESNMKELNNAQIEYAKDKVALCLELSEVSSLNEKLSNSLVSKHKKLDQLHDTKKQIESAASAQLRAAEQMQKVERAALVELLQDHKRVVAQRDSLSRAQSEYIKQLTELRANTATLNRNIETANRNHIYNVQVIQNLEGKLQTSTSEAKTLHAQIQGKDQELLQTRIAMEEMRKQGQALEGSVSYLQNTIQRLSLDLDKSRESEMVRINH